MGQKKGDLFINIKKHWYINLVHMALSWSSSFQNVLYIVIVHKRRTSVIFFNVASLFSSPLFELICHSSHFMVYVMRKDCLFSNEQGPTITYQNCNFQCHYSACCYPINNKFIINNLIFRFIYLSLIPKPNGNHVLPPIFPQCY